MTDWQGNILRLLCNMFSNVYNILQICALKSSSTLVIELILVGLFLVQARKLKKCQLFDNHCQMMIYFNRAFSAARLAKTIYHKQHKSYNKALLQDTFLLHVCHTFHMGKYAQKNCLCFSHLHNSNILFYTPVTKTFNLICNAL